MRFFREWKRQGYEMVLDSLKKYSMTLQQVEESQRTMTPLSISSTSYRQRDLIMSSMHSSSGGSKAISTPTNHLVSTGGTAVKAMNSSTVTL